MTVVKSVSAGLRDCEIETQLNLNRPLRIRHECKRVFITNVKGTLFRMSESEEASKRR